MVKIRGVDPSSTLGGDLVARQRQLRASVRAQGMCEGDVSPSEAGKLCIFATEIVQFGRAIWWILLGANLEQAIGKKNTVLLTDQNFAFWKKLKKKIARIIKNQPF